MTEMKKRILMTLSGVGLGGFSVGLFNTSAFGMDPFQVFAHGIWPETRIGFGTFYMILNLAMLVVIFFLDRKKIGITTFINIFLLGYAVEFSSWYFGNLWPEPSFALRMTLLLAAVVIMCFGSALYYVADLGVSTYDAIALILTEKTKWKFQYLRIASDVICTGIGYLLGAVVGVGTLITAFFMGPLIAFFREKVAMPMRYGRKTLEVMEQKG